MLWRYEVVNVPIQSIRKNRITAAKARGFLDDLESFSINVDDGSSQVFGSVYELAARHRLTSYDAAYLELAVRRQLPLATLDDDLRKAAVASGVSLLEA